MSGLGQWGGQSSSSIRQRRLQHINSNRHKSIQPVNSGHVVARVSVRAVNEIYPGVSCQVHVGTYNKCTTCTCRYCVVSIPGSQSAFVTLPYLIVGAAWTGAGSLSAFRPPRSSYP